jgi:hypothetical protein
MGVDFVRAAESDLVRAEHEFRVDHGRSFFELGLLLAIVVDGSRDATSSLVPGTGERAIRVVEDELVVPSLVLNVYPLGGRSRDARFCCSERFSWDWFANSIVLQVGLDVDFTDLSDKWLAGMMFEPVAGLGLGGGVGLVEGEALLDGFAAGMLIEDPNERYATSRYFARGYVGLTVSAAVLAPLRKP